MKFTKIGTQGKTYLVFSLAALTESSAPLAKAVLRSEEGIGADGVLFLTPTLHADVRLTAFDREGKRTLSHEILYALATYLCYVAGLPIHEYEAETDEGILPLRIRGGTPPLFCTIRGKCKRLYSDVRMDVKNTAGTYDIVRQTCTYAVFMTENIRSFDPDAVFHACALASLPPVDGVVAVCREGEPSGDIVAMPRGDVSRYRLRLRMLREETFSPADAAGAVLCLLIARGEETYGREVALCHDGGALLCRMGCDGRCRTSATARVILRGTCDLPFGG